MLRHGNQAFGRIVAAAENDVLNGFEQRGGNVLIHHLRARVHNAHVHAVTHGVVEEHRMHGFAQIIVAAESEGEVAHAATDVCARQIVLDPCRCLNEVEGVAVVFAHAGGHGQDVGVENDVAGLHAGLLGE